MYEAHKWLSNVVSVHKNAADLMKKRKMDNRWKEETHTQKNTWIKNANSEKKKEYKFIHHPCLTFKSTTRTNSVSTANAVEWNRSTATNIHWSWIMRHMKWKVFYNKSSTANENRKSEWKRHREKKKWSRKDSKKTQMFTTLSNCLIFCILSIIFFFLSHFLWLSQSHAIAILPTFQNSRTWPFCFSSLCYHLFQASCAMTNGMIFFSRSAETFIIFFLLYEAADIRWHTVGYDTDYQLLLNTNHPDK